MSLSTTSSRRWANSVVEISGCIVAISPQVGQWAVSLFSSRTLNKLCEMLIRLDPRSDKPIYRQISDAVATSIEDGTVDPGERLPSARSLGDALDVNMHTVLRAYSQLEEWGLAEMRRGRGGVVVSSGANLKGMAKRLVGQARRQRLELGELTRLVEEAWN